MVKFEVTYQAWLETQEKKDEITELVEKFFNGFRDLYGIELIQVDCLNYKCSDAERLHCSAEKFGIKRLYDNRWLFCVQECSVYYTKIAYEGFSFVPRPEYGSEVAMITSEPCSCCRYVMFEPTPDQIRSKICHRHLLT